MAVVDGVLRVTAQQRIRLVGVVGLRGRQRVLGVHHAGHHVVLIAGDVADVEGTGLELHAVIVLDG